MKHPSGENCTFHPDVPADARCSRCGRPFCRACLTLVVPSPTAGGEGTSVSSMGGLVCIECKMKGDVRGGLIFTFMGVFWIIMETVFISSVPSWGREFFSIPLTVGFLIGIGIIVLGGMRYVSSRGKLIKFQKSLPLKAKFPLRVELGIAKCPNCGGTLKKAPRKVGEVVVCEYCGTPIVAQPTRSETNN